MRSRTHEEQLVERQLSVVLVAAGHAQNPLKIRRQQHLHIDDAGREPRRKLIHHVEYVLDEIIALGVPASAFELVGGKSAAQGDHMFALRGQAVIDHARHDGGDKRLCRIPAIFGVVNTAVNLVHAGGNVGIGLVVLREFGVNPLIFGGGVYRHVDLERSPGSSEVSNIIHKLRRKMIRPDQLSERN